MAIPDVHNLAIYQGDDFAETVTIVDENGAPQDLSGYTLEAQIRRQHRSPEAVDFEIDDSNASDGIVVLSLDNAQTARLPAGGSVWDLQRSVQTFTPGEQIDVMNTVQRIDISEATSGTWNFEFDGQVSNNIAYNIEPSGLQLTLSSFPAIGGGNIEVSGTPGDYLIEFVGVFAGLTVDTVKIDYRNLVGTQGTVDVLQVGGIVYSQDETTYDDVRTLLHGDVNVLPEVTRP